MTVSFPSDVLRSNYFTFLTRLSSMEKAATSGRSPPLLSHSLRVHGCRLALHAGCQRGRSNTKIHVIARLVMSHKPA